MEFAAALNGKIRTLMCSARPLVVGGCVHHNILICVIPPKHFPEIIAQ